jgi:hypothetical protein
MDLDTLSMGALYDWQTEAEDFLDTLKVAIHDYVDERRVVANKVASDKRRVLDAIKQETKSLNDSERVRKTAGITDGDMLKAVNVLLDMQVRFGAITPERECEMRAAIESGPNGVARVGAELGIGFKS